MKSILLIVAVVIVWWLSLVGAHIIGFNNGIAQPRPQFTEEQLDTQCAVWLFKSNLKEAKARICKGRK